MVEPSLQPPDASRDSRQGPEPDEPQGWGIPDPELEPGSSDAGAPGGRTPGVGGALRRALVDLASHAVQLVVANVAWGVALSAMLVSTVFGLVPTLLVAGLVGVTWVGIVRLTALIVRRRNVALVDAFRAWRQWLIPGFAGGSLTLAAVLLLLLNIRIGAESGSIPGWALTTLAGWVLLYAWLLGLTFWPLLLDPEREGRPARQSLRLAALLLLARPIPIAALGIILGLLAALSAASIAAILTVAAAFVALAASHLVLPLADALEARLSGGHAFAGN